MTKESIIAAIETIPVDELRDLQDAIKARRKKKGPNEGLLSQFREHVKAYGFQQVRLCFGVVRKEHLTNKVVKAKPAKTKKPAKKKG